MIPHYRKCRFRPDPFGRIPRKLRADEQVSPAGWKRILVAVKLSTETATLLYQARKLAAQHSDEIMVLHVVEPVQTVKDFGYGPVVWQRPNGSAVRSAEKNVRAVARRSLGSLCNWSSHIRSGAACDEIVKASEELNVGLIIMGTDGRLPAQAMDCAGMAARVISRALCPVLVMRPVLKSQRVVL